VLIQGINIIIYTFPGNSGLWVLKIPYMALALLANLELGLTFCEMRHEAMCSLINQIAFPRHTNGSQNVISSAHDLPDASFCELTQNASSARLQFVLENDESDEVELRLSLFAFRLLDLHPIQFGDMFSGASYNTVTSVRIV
jgi:hypothetical protein